MTIDDLYKPKNNVIADLYPTTKFFILSCYTIISIVLGFIKINGYPVFMMLWFIVVPILCIASGVIKRYITSLSKLLILVIMIIIFQTFLFGGDEVLFQIGPIKAYATGFQNALTISSNILNIAGIFMWFFQTTENKELVYALEMKKMNYKAAYVLLSTLQMIEELRKKSQVIMNSQRARGVETEGKLITRAKAFFPIMVPFVVGSISDIEERALTLEARGFTAPREKTHIFVVKPSGNERIAKSIAIIITLIILLGVALTWVL